jgi:hypothetical protein
VIWPVGAKPLPRPRPRVRPASHRGAAKPLIMQAAALARIEEMVAGGHSERMDRRKGMSSNGMSRSAPPRRGPRSSPPISRPRTLRSAGARPAPAAWSWSGSRPTPGCWPAEYRHEYLLVVGHRGSRNDDRRRRFRLLPRSADRYADRRLLRLSAGQAAAELLTTRHEIRRPLKELPMSSYRCCAGMNRQVRETMAGPSEFFGPEP